jgi:hypothetical protein
LDRLRDRNFIKHAINQKTQFAHKQMIFEPAGFSSDTSFIVYMGNR